MKSLKRCLGESSFWPFSGNRPLPVLLKAVFLAAVIQLSMPGDSTAVELLSPEQVKEIAATSKIFREKRLENVDLSGMNLQEANFSSAQLVNVIMSGAKLDSADFTGAVITGGSWKQSILRNANLRESAFIDVDLEQADLSYAYVYCASIKRTNLNRARLIGTNFKITVFEEVSLKAADLDSANLEGAKFIKTSLTAAKNVQKARNRGTKDLQTKKTGSKTQP